ncbi:Rrf2 family transcriptional regulator [Ideonella sp. DXS29W]|uniref:Rrf2 family transcriptional regulator n=1 Tax=Ideonella lacteola TaxID=2984193 RepID=A0ABU9BY67_9BURK
MRLTTRGRHAVAAMTHLALHDGERPVVLAQLGGMDGISLSYLAVLFSRLRREGLVRVVRGKGGGYLLGRPAAEIDMADIVAAVDSGSITSGCGGRGHCRGAGTGRCAAHELWMSLDAALIERLRAVTLQDLADERRARTRPTAG